MTSFCVTRFRVLNKTIVRSTQKISARLPFSNLFLNFFSLKYGDGNTSVHWLFKTSDLASLLLWSNISEKNVYNDPILP